MPFELKCESCGHVLMETRELLGIILRQESAHLWYRKLYLQVHGACPKCGHLLPGPEDYANVMNVKVCSADPERRISE